MAADQSTPAPTPSPLPATGQPAASGAPPFAWTPTIAGREVPHYVPSVHQVYNHAHASLEKTPAWGQEPSSHATHRFMATPLQDVFEPDHLLFLPGPESPPKLTAQKNLGLGSGMILLGLLAMLFSEESTQAAVILLGLYLVVSGLVSLLVSLFSLGQDGALWHAVTSIFHVIVGAYMLQHRHTGAIIVLIMVAIWMVFKGFAKQMVSIYAVLAIALVLVVVRWRGLPGFLIGFDVALAGYHVAMTGFKGLKEGAGARESDPLVSHPPPPAYSA